MVRDAAPLIDRQLRGAYVHPPIELHRIRVDDLPTEVVGQIQCKVRFSCGGGSDDGDDRF